MPDSTSVRALLEGLAFTEGLSPTHLDRLAEAAAPISWTANARVFREGDVGRELYLVVEGRVAVETLPPGRVRATILTVGPGEVFGWSSMFDARPKTAAVRAVEPTDALVFDAEKLRNICDADPSLGYAVARRLLKVVAERLRATRTQLGDLYGG